MASLRNPKTWAPYINTKDCSQGFCSLYCPQWCYIIFPPPPPFEYPDEDSGSMFSPLVIAIIGLLASSFLLVSYYAIVTKYCKDRGSTSEHQVEEMEIIHQVPALHESWHFTANNGLDEALIQLITVCEYKRGDGLVEGTECSVCLSKFDDGERLRLLPKCSHAFHLPCIDMWLKSHSNCPLCRAGIISVTYGITPPPAEAGNSAQNHSDQQMQPQDENAETSHEESGIISVNNAAHKGLLFPESHTVAGIHVRDRHGRPVRRSISMGYFQFSIPDSLCINQDEEAQQEEAHGLSAGYGSKALHCVLSRPIAMKRSFSSGIFFSSRHHSTTIPF